MEGPDRVVLRIGDWRVDPASSQISRNGETARLEARTMRLLLCLAEHPGEVVSIDELLDKVWTDVAVSPDSVYQSVASLRRALGDDPKQPTYIATVPRLGYRMVATVAPWKDPSEAAVDDPTAAPKGGSRERPGPPSLRKVGLILAAAGVLCVALIA